MSAFRVCVFCGAGGGTSPEYVHAAASVGARLAAEGIGVVFGAGGVGMMGALSDAALSVGGEAIGVIPRSLIEREYGREDLTELHVVESMHDRKALMHELSAAFVALPGGLGTFEELFEVMTWAQLGLHTKPIIVLNVLGYFDPMVATLDHAVATGFLSDADRRLMTVTTSVDELMVALLKFRTESTAV